MRNIGSIKTGDGVCRWVWSDNVDVWYGLDGDHTGARLAGTVRPITPEESEAWFPPVAVLASSLKPLRDTLTREAITKGVAYNGHTLSTSLESQVRWLGLFVMRLVSKYPQPVSTPEGVLMIGSAEEVQAIASLIFGHVAEEYSAGVLAEDAIAKAGDSEAARAALEAYVLAD